MGAVRAIREKKKFSYRPFLTTHLPPCTRNAAVVCFHFYRPLSSPLFHYKTPGLRHYTLLICMTWNNLFAGIQQHSLVTNNCSIRACINGDHRYNGEISQNVLFFLSVTIIFSMLTHMPFILIYFWMISKPIVRMLLYATVSLSLQLCLLGLDGTMYSGNGTMYSGKTAVNEGITCSLQRRCEITHAFTEQTQLDIVAWI